MNFSIIETRTVPTVQFEINGQKRIFHSKYDPLKEVASWVNNIKEDIVRNKHVLIIGLGAGYHIAQMAKLLPDQQIHVIEFNIEYEKWFKTTPLFDQIQSLNNVMLHTINDIQSLMKNSHQNNILIQKTAMDIMPVEYANMKSMLKDFQMQKDSIKKQIGNMMENFAENVSLNDPGIGKLKDMYKGKKVILVSAGPSLDKQLPMLKRIHEENEIIIASVGTAVKPLLKSGITPDFMMIIDPNEPTMKQLEGVELTKTPLYYLSTAYHETIMLHKGMRHIIWQNGFKPAREKAKIHNDPVIQTGGSVATTLLDTIVFLGGEMIALVGQDLAFTNGKSHASHTAAGKDMSETNAFIKTLNYYRSSEVMTANNLTIYRKWFERYAENNKHLQLYNCTEGGAYINGWSHIPLSEFYYL